MFSCQWGGTYKYGQTYVLTPTIATGYHSDIELTNTMPGANTTLVITPEPNTDTPYKIVIQRQDTNGNYVDYQTLQKKGTTDSTVTYDCPTYTGFSIKSPSNSVASITVAGDGSTTRTIKYARNQYRLRVDRGDYISNVSYGSSYVYYDAPVQLTVTSSPKITYDSYSGDSSNPVVGDTRRQVTQQSKYKNVTNKDTGAVITSGTTFRMPASDLNIRVNGTIYGNSTFI